MTSTKMKLKFHLKMFLKTHLGLQFELLARCMVFCSRVSLIYIFRKVLLAVACLGSNF